MKIHELMRKGHNMLHISVTNLGNTSHGKWHNGDRGGKAVQG